MSQDLRIDQTQHAARITANVAIPDFHQDVDDPLLARAQLLQMGLIEPAQEALPLVLVQDTPHAASGHAWSASTASDFVGKAAALNRTGTFTATAARG